MGQLARWSAETLGVAFRDLLAPRGLVPKISYEAGVFTDALGEEVGYSPAADVLIEYCWDGEEMHAWVELEVSRGDPVANPAKFLVALTERSARPGEIFVFALSQAIQRGRAALCHRFVRLMRDRGFPVYSDDLLPSATGHLVTRLNVNSHDEFEELFAREPESVKRALKEDLNVLAKRIYSYARPSR
jgi:hypothetical protein